MEPEGSLSCLQGPASARYVEPDASNQLILDVLTTFSRLIISVLIFCCYFMKGTNYGASHYAVFSFLLSMSAYLGSNYSAQPIRLFVDVLLLHLELLCMSASVNCNVDHEWDL
jgi:hypothetical protein